MNDTYGQAFLDYQNNCVTQDIKTLPSVAGKDIIPLKYLFRSYQKMPKIEQKALNLCTGKTLDIGCGTGIHSLYLQKKGFDIMAIDISKGAIEVCKLRGTKNARPTKWI